MSNETEKPWPLLGIIAAGFGLVAFLAMVLIGEYRFFPALFLGILIGLLVALFLFLAFLWGRDESDYADEGSGSGGAAASAGSAAASAGSAAAAPALATAPATAPATKAAPSGDATASDAGDGSATGAAAAAPDPAPEPDPEPTAAPEPAPAPTAAPEPAPAPAPPAAEPVPAAKGTGADYDGDGVREGANEGVKPATMTAPKDGVADDLKKIKGVGPKLEALLNRLGFYHFEQVASWSAEEVAWVDANLEGFKGRVSRDNWVEQAGVLARGGETAFSKKVDDGDVY